MRTTTWLMAIVVCLLASGCGSKNEDSKTNKEDKKTSAATSKEGTSGNNTNPPSGPGGGVRAPGDDTQGNSTNGSADKKKGEMKSFLGEVMGARSAAKRITQANNLKQIALAMHLHHDTHKTMPADAIYSKDGKPLLSWRVKLLPYLEATNLYDQFHLDEPWDSPHNKALIPKMPKIFESPLAPTEAGMTRLMLITGKDVPFGGNKKTRFRDIRDGMSQTVLAVYAGSDKSVTWTQPGDLPWKEGEPAETVGTIGPEGIQVALFDGRVFPLPASLSAEHWKHLTHHADGTPVPLEEILGQ